jgi:gliding motility-associated-like protein
VKFIANHTACQRLLPVIFFTLFTTFSYAQLHADFTTDKTGGCSPLAISFTNTSTGSSANATWHWDLGNGNISLLKNAGAIYYDERSYTITLTVTDGNQTSSVTKTITVYKKPATDFTISPASGCLPLQTTLTSTSTAADETISSLYWDFGDGSSQQSASPSITHQYSFLQTATISLTAITSNGCSNTIVKSNAVTVHPPVQPAFNANQTITCNVPATIQFTNNSTGPGTLSYYWEFGDNTTSTNRAPSHVYAAKGIYTVRLTVTSSAGCTAVFTRPSYINVANFNSNFQEPALICSNGSVTFNNTSTPVPNQSSWLFDGVNTFTTFGNNPISYAFGTTGAHTIQLTNTFGPCQEIITKTVDVKAKPELNGFLINPGGLCGAPVQVGFQDTTANAAAWTWNFNWPFNDPNTVSNQQSPVYTYTNDNAYQVKLTIATAEGCTASVVKPLGISRPLIGIFLDNGYSDRGCDVVTVKFKPRSTEPITSYQWDFGDGGGSSDPEPTYTYTEPGNYAVVLTYTTINGCTGTATYGPVVVLAKPVASFNVQQTVCGNTPVHFQTTSTGNVTQNFWNFGDHTGYISVNPIIHQYYNEGVYNVSLIATNGFCSDTITQTAAIQVFPPFPKISPVVVYTCEGNRGLVTFTDASRQAEAWNWNFGDTHTNSYTIAQTTVQNDYAATGVYKVVLAATNGACTVKDSLEARVLVKQHPLLSPANSTICAGGVLSLTVKNLERPPFPPNSSYYEYPYGYLGFQNADGTLFTGNVAGQLLNVFPWSANLSNFTYGEYQLRTITRSSSHGCNDTTNFVTITVKGPAAAFNITTDNVCYREPVVLQDASTTRNGVAIASCEWNFGDASVTTAAPGTMVSHIYAAPGDYSVILKVIDAEGCVSYATRTARVKGPKASFLASATNVQLNGTVTFNNTTNIANSGVVNYQWTFGAAGSSANYSPSFTFTTPGTYIVTLIAQGPSCSDTARQTITVNNFSGGFGMSTTLIGDQGQCPPVLARFQNASFNWIYLRWDFGDGTSLENQNTPSHIYHTPGIYPVTLTVRGFNGMTIVQHDTVRVSRPQATIQADALSGCIGHQLTLHAPTHTNVASWVWDFGNGHIENTTDSFSTHQYLSPGSFNASLLVKDENGCALSVALTSPVIINPDPVITISPSAPVVCKGVGVSLQAGGANSYTWSPSTGLDNAVSASPIASPANTTSYTTQGIDNNGCKGTVTTTVIVPQPFAINATQNAGLCKGESVQLNATGASRYEWINTTTGLNNTQIANPIASPQSSILYTVVGYDVYQCYSDTQRVNVTVHALPFINAGPDRQVSYGSPNQLNTSSSNDVVRWNWSPSQFLDCSNCPAPVSKPYQAMEYVVTAYTANDCIAKDTIKLAVICGDGNIYIPNAFTPDNNGKNDGFTILGHGVRLIRSLRIYNRWGEVVFDRKNFYPNDASAAWKGTFKGLNAPAGAYVYIAEMECTAGESFMRKGTVTLIR